MGVIEKVVHSIQTDMYIRLLAILVITILAAFLSKAILKKILKPLTRKTKTKIDDIIVNNISSVVFSVIIILGIRIIAENLEWKTRIHHHLVDTLFILVMAVLLIRMIDSFSRQWMKDWKHKTKTTTDERIIPLLQKMMKAVVLILALIFIFSAWGVSIAPLLTTAGIAGLALGLAVKDSLSNILGGLQLVFDKTFKVGDKVQLDSGEMGVILDIGLRSTKLRTYDNEVIFIPNGILANTKVKNFTQPDLSVRVNVDFGVEYGSDTAQVRRVVLEAVAATAGVLEDPEPVVQFLKMSDFSLDFVARAWVKDYNEAYAMQLVLTDNVYNALNKAGIGIPFPTRTVFTKKLD